MKNILFYGASVTAQTGKSSFFENLMTENFAFSRLSYPSSQFYNAGFYNIPRIDSLSTKPDCVFFEWSTTGETEFDSNKLKYYINFLISKKIIPVFLLLPKKDTFNFNRPCDAQLYQLNKEYGVPLLDFRDLLDKHNPDDMLRDNVHTTEFGAKLYAERIVSFLEEFSFSDMKEIQVERDHAFNIAAYDLNCSLTENQTLQFVFSSSEFSEIAISHTIGPYSPVLEYLSNGVLISKQSIFDAWCHYERENFTTLVPQSVFRLLSSNALTIRISSDMPNFSITKTGEIFDLPRMLKIQSIFTCDLQNFSYSLN